MRRNLYYGLCFLSVVVCCTGCSHSPAESDTTSGVKVAIPSAPSTDLSGAVGVPIMDGIAALSSENATISFYGSKPDGSGHDGGFSEFEGSLTVNPQTSALTAVTIEIETESIWSDTERLTGHLKSADFFDVKNFPKASFVSTDISPGGASDGEYIVMGELTLRATSREVSFPVKARIADGRIALASDFTINRQDYGLTYPGIVDDIKVSVRVGQVRAAE